MYMFGVVGETHVHDYFEIISFYNSKRRTYITFSDMSLIINYVICVICISKKLKYCISKTKQGNQKLKDNLLCYFKLDFRVQFSFNVRRVRFR